MKIGPSQWTQSRFQNIPLKPKCWGFLAWFSVLGVFLFICLVLFFFIVVWCFFSLKFQYSVCSSLGYPSGVTQQHLLCAWALRRCERNGRIVAHSWWNCVSFISTGLITASILMTYRRQDPLQPLKYSLAFQKGISYDIACTEKPNR